MPLLSFCKVWDHFSEPLWSLASATLQKLQHASRKTVNCQKPMVLGTEIGSAATAVKLLKLAVTLISKKADRRHLEVTRNHEIPGRATISNRTSTMASQFARARAPYVVPMPDRFVSRYTLLGIDPAKPECCYCGGPPTEWDHLFPMVAKSRWTGYFTEIANLVPACGKCNQSRGAKPVAAWMRSAAPWSPSIIFCSRDGLTPAQASIEVERRIALIEAAVASDPPTCLPVDDDALEKELEDCRLELNALRFRAEKIATELRHRYQARIST